MDDYEKLREILDKHLAGALPASELAKHLEGKVAKVHVIGDARNPSNAMEAIAAGAEVGRAI